MSGLHFWEQFDQDQIERIVQSLGINTTGENSEWIYVYCPYHNNTSTRAAEVNLETGFFYCFSCGISKSLIDLVMDKHECSKFEALRFLHSYKQDNCSINVDKLFHDNDIPTYDRKLIVRLYNDLLNSLEAKQYLAQRNIHSTTWNKYELGYSKKRKMITIPVDHPYKQGYVGFVARSIHNKKFLNSTGLPRKHVLFGMDKVGDSNHVYLTESAISAMMIDEAGHPAVASLGSTISNEQLELLSRWRNITVVQDNDDAGEKMWQRVHSKLPRHNVRHVIWPDKTYNDVGESGIQYVKENIGG